MIRSLYAMYLQFLVNQDEAELIERTIDGSASVKWAVQVRMQSNDRLTQIDELRARRFSRRLA